MIKFSPQKQKFIGSANDMFGAGSIIKKQKLGMHLQMQMFLNNLIGL